MGKRGDQPRGSLSGPLADLLNTFGILLESAIFRLAPVGYLREVGFRSGVRRDASLSLIMLARMSLLDVCVRCEPVPGGEADGRSRACRGSPESANPVSAEDVHPPRQDLHS